MKRLMVSLLVLAGMFLGAAVAFACPIPNPKIYPLLVAVGEKTTVEYKQNDPSENTYDTSDPLGPYTRYMATRNVFVTPDLPGDYNRNIIGGGYEYIWHNAGTRGVSITVNAEWRNNHGNLCSSTGSKAATVTIVGVKDIEFKWGNLAFTSIWTPDGSYVQWRKTVTFKADPYPVGASWPGSWPTWTGATASSQGQATRRYPAPDFYSVKAKCGTSSLTRRMVAYDITELKAVTFENDDNKVTDYTTDFAGDGGSVYNLRGWDLTAGVNNPVHYAINKPVSIKVKILMSPSAMSTGLNASWDVKGTTLYFHKSFVTAMAGLDTEIDNIISPVNLGNKVGVSKNKMNFTFYFPDGTSDLNTVPSDRLTAFITFGELGSGPTYKRVSTVCEKCNDQTDQQSAADALWNYVAEQAQLHFFGQNTASTKWGLLDGAINADCISWARCMQVTVDMMGITPSEVIWVIGCPKYNPPPPDGYSPLCEADGSLTRPQHVNSAGEYLFLKFADLRPNVGEGCCKVAGKLYALKPKLKEDNSYKMLQRLKSSLNVLWQSWGVYDSAGHVGLLTREPFPWE